MVVIVCLPSSLHLRPLPLRFRPPPDPPPRLPSPLSFEALLPLLCSSSLLPSKALSPSEPPDPPPCSSFPTPFEALSLSLPEPPDPPDASFVCSVLLADVLSGVVTVLLPSIPSPQACTHISTMKPPFRMATKNIGGGGLLAYGLHTPVGYRSLFGCADDSSFAYEIQFPVIYRFSFGCVDWRPISSCLELATTPPYLCMDCSAIITTSCFIHLQTIQVVSLRFSNLFTGVVLIVLECSRGLSLGPSLTLVRPFTAVCSLVTVLYSSAFVILKYFCTMLWQFDRVMSDISIPWVLLVDIYCLFSSSMECVPLPISSSILSGFVSGSKTFKIRDTSDIEVLIKGSSKWCSITYVCVAISRIVNCALAAVSISGIIPLNVVSNSQGLLSPCSLVVETRPLHAISCLCVLYASILLCFNVIVGCLASMALLSCFVNTLSLNGE